MKVIRKDISFPIDVDETLIKWLKPGTPYSSKEITLNYYGETIRALPLKGNIRVLRASVARGRNVVVWSGNGFSWAEQVLKKLGLHKLDLTVMSKPAGYLDDLDCDKWMGSRVYVPEEV